MKLEKLVAEYLKEERMSDDNFPVHPIQAMVNGLNSHYQKERAKTQMTLGQFIEALASVDPERKIVGVGDPISYRGYYSDLAFEPDGTVRTVRHVLASARYCMGKVFEGYKGGDFMMGENTPIWSAEYGHGGAPRIMGLDLESDPITLVLKPEDPEA